MVQDSFGSAWGWLRAGLGGDSGLLRTDWLGLSRDLARVVYGSA